MRAAPSRCASSGEADQIAEQHRSLGHAVGDLLVGSLLQALDDGLGQDVGQQRIGLGPGAVGHGEGIADDQRDDAEGGGGGGDVEIGEQQLGSASIWARSGGNRNHAARCSARPISDHRDRETETRHAVDGEGDGGGDDVVDLDARVVAELADEKEQAR